MNTPPIINVMIISENFSKVKSIIKYIKYAISIVLNVSIWEFVCRSLLRLFWIKKPWEDLNNKEQPTTASFHMIL